MSQGCNDGGGNGGSVESTSIRRGSQRRLEVLGDEPPLTARSVIASTLLGTRPPRLPVSRLVRAGAVFGIAEGTVRTALSRMLAAGEVELDDGRYRLAGRLLERQRRLDAGRAAVAGPWDGTWELAVVAVDRRSAAERAELRAAARALHLAELREGVWLRPANLDPSRLATARAVFDAQCVRFVGASAEMTGEQVRELWALDAWAARARLLQGALEEVTGQLDGGEPEELADAFVLSAAVLRHLAADPRLPDELLPPGWPAPELRARFERYYVAFQALLADWLQRPD